MTRRTGSDKQASGKKKRTYRSLTRKRRTFDIRTFACASGFNGWHDNFCRAPVSDPLHAEVVVDELPPITFMPDELNQREQFHLIPFQFCREPFGV